MRLREKVEHPCGGCTPGVVNMQVAYFRIAEQSYLYVLGHRSTSYFIYCMPTVCLSACQFIIACMLAFLSVWTCKYMHMYVAVLAEAGTVELSLSVCISLYFSLSLALLTY